MRINKMVTERKMLRCLNKFSQLILGEFVCGSWGLKGQYRWLIKLKGRENIERDPQRNVLTSLSNVIIRAPQELNY